jgi:hypothetical protein
MIGSCDNCDRVDVPVSHGTAAGMETTQCYLCQGDEADPYGELEPEEQQVKYRIKIVLKATPNADGEWLVVEADLSAITRWLDASAALGDHVPETHFLCAIERVRT